MEKKREKGGSQKLCEHVKLRQIRRVDTKRRRIGDKEHICDNN